MLSRTLAALTAAWLWGGSAGSGTTHLDSLPWRGSGPDFGGFSGLELSADGTDFTVIGDRGFIVEGRLARDGRGRMTAVEAGAILRLKDPDGQALERRQEDAEGLARLPDGRLAVSFEGDHRVAIYPRVDGAAEELPRPREFAGMQRNSSLESLAAGADGALYTLPERSGAMARAFPVYRFADGEWSRPYEIPRRGEHLAVGADIGPDGRFYLLERHFGGLVGFSSRVRRFTMGPEGLTDEEELFTSPLGRHGNLEGIAVWRDATGAIRLTMLSDDNQRSFQRTEFVEYRLAE